MPISTEPAHPRSRCVFRVAAGPRVGYGHLMRARALAECLDMDVTVSVRGGRAAKDAARALGPLVANAEALRQADVLVVDDPSREHGASWVARARRSGVRSVSVHDDEQAHDADLVVCASLGIGRLRTRAASMRGVRFYLLDPRLTLARRFRAARREPSPPRVVIALGGGQHVRRVAQRLVDAIVGRCPGVQMVVAAGFSKTPRPPLRGATWLGARGALLEALVHADLAVVAGGVTLYEACALGVPAVGLAIVPGQRRAIRAFARHGAVIDAGGGSASVEAIRSAAAGVARLLGSRELRATLAARARGTVDGRGAQRVARRIHALLRARRRHA